MKQILKKDRLNFSISSRSITFEDLFGKKVEDNVDYSSLTEEKIRNEADFINWENVSKKSPIFNYSDEFFMDYSSELEWKKIAERKDLEENFILKFANKLPINDWAILERNLSEKTINFLIENYNFNLKQHIQFNRKISSKFICKHLDKIEDINMIVKYTNINIDFIRKYKDVLDWKIVSRFFHFKKEKDLEEFKDYISWEVFIENFVLSENLIEKYKEYIIEGVISGMKNKYLLELENIKNNGK